MGIGAIAEITKTGSNEFIVRHFGASPNFTVYATDELAAYTMYLAKKKESDMNFRVVIICIAAVLLAMIGAAFAARMQFTSFSREVFVQCLHANKSYSSENGNPSCK